MNSIDEIQQTAGHLIDKTKDFNTFVTREEQAQYNADKVRPMYLDNNGQLTKFSVENEHDKLINSKEEYYSRYSSLIGSDVPYWIKVEDLYFIATVICDIEPIISTHDANPKMVLDPERLVNFSEIENYDELIQAKMLPSPPDFGQDIANQFWQPDSNLLSKIEQNLNISIEEHGSCCVPFAFVSEIAKNANGHSVIHMPPSCIFDSEDAYYHTLFHEITHVQLVKDRLLQSHVLSDISLENTDAAKWIKEKNEVAAELGASILFSVYKNGGMPDDLTKYSNAYMNSHGAFALTEAERKEVVEATSLAVHHVLEAVPQIAVHKDAPYQQEISTNKSFGTERERHVVIDADYEVLNQLMGSKSLIDAKSQQRLAHAELLLQQIKHQMKQMKRAELEQQAQARVQTQTERPAGKELAAAQPERGARTTAQTPAKTNASKSQPSKAKEPSKSRDMER